MKTTMTKKLFTFILLLSGMFSFSFANAQCKDLLKSHVDWLKSSGTEGNDHYVQLVFVSLAGTAVTQYGLSGLKLKTTPTAPYGVTTLLTGTATIYNTGGGKPFTSSTKTENVTIDVNTGRVTIGSIVIDAPQCSNMLMYGFSNAGLVPRYYVLTFLDTKEPMIK